VLAFAVIVVPFFAGFAAAQSRANPFDGSWVNIDSTSRGMAMIEIAGNMIHPYGACQPRFCDMGEIKASSFAYSVNGGAPAALFAEANQGFAEQKIVVVLEQGDRLRVEVLTHFTDGSHRADYYMVGYFMRGRQPY
jgi:hypothetical protein